MAAEVGNSKTWRILFAQEFGKHREVELWRQEKLGERPRVTWDHAVIEWLKAHEHKRSIEDDRTRLRVLSEQLRGFSIAQVTPERMREAVESLPFRWKHRFEFRCVAEMLLATRKNPTLQRTEPSSPTSHAGRSKSTIDPINGSSRAFC